MIENDRTPHRPDDRQSFGGQPRVERVVLLDRTGNVRYSSGPPRRRRPPHRTRRPARRATASRPSSADSSRVIETRGGTVLRTVVPIRNREACYRCHDPTHKINGILILDHNVGEVRADHDRDLRWMVAAPAPSRCCWSAPSPSSFAFAVLRRLQRFETTARQIAAGDLDRRVPVEGSDTLSWLAREFNTMADSVTGLVGEVRDQRERLETVINSIDDGIVVLDPAAHASSPPTTRSCAHAGHPGRSAGLLLRDAAAGGLHRRPIARRSPACARATGRCGSASVRGRPTVRAWEEVHASPIHDADGTADARRGSLARHLGPARRRGAAGRVAPPGLARACWPRASRTS